MIDKSKALRPLLFFLCDLPRWYEEMNDVYQNAKDLLSHYMKSKYSVSIGVEARL